MQNRDLRDILGGGVLIAIGLYAAFYAFTNLNLGTFSRMGPGMFPAGLGIVITTLGLLILIPALFRAGEPINIGVELDIRSFVIIVFGVIVFALLIDSFGIAPAVIVMTLIVRLAEEERRFLRPLVLGTILATVAVLIFRLGLGLPFQIIRWPF